MKSLDSRRTALLLIDVMNDFDFSGGSLILRYAIPAAKKIAALKRRFRAAGFATIYVNDNFGEWHCSFADHVARCLSAGSKGREIASLLRPERDDYFVLKPKHSSFYETSLAVLLETIRADTLVLTGFAGNICVLFTANDAAMRGFNLVIPSDCIASQSEAENRRACEQMRTLLKARVLLSRSIR